MTANFYVVATPIGNLEDISYRAIRVLQEVDWIAAEDTRHSQTLLHHFNIKKPLISLHKYNEEQRLQLFIKHLKNHQSIALISDAGTPLISDPGYYTVRNLQQQQIPIIPIPGPCAAITALSAAGLACEKFIFEGFLPAKKSARLSHLKTLLSEKRTLIFYESPHRILKTIEDMIQIFGENRLAVLARELTKNFETIYQASLEKILEFLVQNPQQQKGEFVILIEGETNNSTKETLDLEKAKITLQTLMQELSFKRSVILTTSLTGLPKKIVYELALSLRNAP